MNLQQASSSFRNFFFRIARVFASFVLTRQITTFGVGDKKIEAILVINLDRQPKRWRRVLRELGRFKTSDGISLKSITKRLSAIDARDGRSVAATADVDPNYRIGDQLFVQPDSRLEECFDVDEPIRMTRQEVAVARSHIEAWKAIAAGPHSFVLVLEDDVWFRRGAALAIDRGWRAALNRNKSNGEPHLFYLSYEDAGGTAERADTCETLFKPIRGLWFLSGYVLSQEGAAKLLRAMPVVGPVDTWMNYRFEELNTFALSSPVILQRQDNISDNSYSVLPYLARAGIVDSDSNRLPEKLPDKGPIIAWTTRGERESMAMALSILGLRVRVFDGNEVPISINDIPELFKGFDVLVDPPFDSKAFSAILKMKDSKFILETDAKFGSNIDWERLPPARTVLLPEERSSDRWALLCGFLGLTQPIQAFPLGAPRNHRVFRDERLNSAQLAPEFLKDKGLLVDDSPWILPLRKGWQFQFNDVRSVPLIGKRVVQDTMKAQSKSFDLLAETFPGNLATFKSNGVLFSTQGACLTLSKADTGMKPYNSGAFKSSSTYEHGHFEAEMKAASGAGLITGFFLYRASPRQEIDIEIMGNDPCKMLVNVYFNPGDEGDKMDFGYRGSPCRIDLGFDATQNFHLYSIDWQPGRITWSVDGIVVHERTGWNPTPIPYLPMRLYANLWAPRAEELVGKINESALPANAIFRNISVRSYQS